MAFERPTLPALRKRVIADFEANLPGVDARMRQSRIGVHAMVHADLANEHYGLQASIARNVLPDLAEADWLARWGNILGIVRHGATAAAGAVRFSGADGSIVPAGSELRRSDGAIVATTEQATIVAGAAIAPVRAVIAGLAGNTEEDVALATLAALPGVAAKCFVEAALTGGADLEDLESWRQRILFRLQEPPQGGAAIDYWRWAREVPGVTRAWVYPKELGAGTVTVRFMMDGTYEDGIPHGVDAPYPSSYTEDVLRVWQHIEPLRPVTAEVFVCKPVPKALNVTIAGLVKSAGAGPIESVKAAIVQELKDMLVRRAAPGQTIHRSWLWEAVSIATGEDHHAIAAPTSDFACSPGEIARLGVVTYS